MNIRKFACAVLTAGVGLGMAAGPASANEIENFYKGKQLRMIVGSGAGGGYDVYARLVERHLPRHIPGNPSIITQNMTGAGGIVATNYMANAAPKDGTVIGGLQRFVALDEVMGQTGPRFKSAELNWLGSLAKESGVCGFSPRAGVNSLEDVFEREYTVGGTGPNSTEFWPALLRNLLAARIKLIRGYPATPQVHLAIERGEVDGVCQSWASFAEQATDTMRRGVIKPVVQIALQPDPEMTAMGVPMLFDYITPHRLAQGQNVADVQTFFKLTLVPLVMGRPFAMAPGVPAERVKAIRTAFVAMVEDPQFLAEAQRLGRVVEFVTGDEIQDLIAEMSATPPEKLAALRDHFKFTGPVEQVKLEVMRHTGKVIESKNGGRSIVIDHQGNEVEASISGSQTKVSINGQEAKRSAVKAGMSCTFVYFGPGTQAQELNCQN